MTTLIFSFLTFHASTIWGQAYRVETLPKPETDEISEELAGQLATSGYKILKGKSRTVCEIWPCKQWQISEGFQASESRLYPFSQGQFIGVVRFPRRCSDFRDQQIGKGWYTMRFALQPVDGNHEGTSPTRDFLVLIRAEDDKSAKAMELEALMEKSAEAAGSTHPAMLCLQRVGDTTDKLAMKHDEERDWWKLHFRGNGVANGKQQEVKVDLVVVGHAEE